MSDGENIDVLRLFRKNYDERITAQYGAPAARFSVGKVLRRTGDLIEELR